MFKKRLDKNSVFHYDPDTDKAIIQTFSDPTAVIEANKREINDHAGGYKSEGFNKVGTIDKVVYLAWCRKKGIGTEEAWKDNELLLTFLRDPDNAAFRTHPTFFKANK